MWQVVRSVTTVAKAVRASCRPALMRCRSTLTGTCCISGCTDSTRLGRYLSYAALTWRPTTAAVAVAKGTCTRRGWVAVKLARQMNGYRTMKE